MNSNLGWGLLALGVVGVVWFATRETAQPSAPMTMGGTPNFQGTYDSGWEAAGAIAHTVDTLAQTGLAIYQGSRMSGTREVSENSSTPRAA
jgi:hypothetical protein